MDKPERRPSEVIEAILKHVPEDKVILRRYLLGIREDSFYTPPESMVEIWVRIGLTLKAYLSSPPTLDYEIRIGQIVRGEATD